MLNIAMIGGTYEPEVLDDMVKRYRYGVDIPACVLQWKMIQGLGQDAEVKLNLINERRVPTYPVADLIFAKRETWSTKQAYHAVQFPFINLPFLKKISKVVGIMQELRRWEKSDCPGDKVVLVYALHTPYLLASSIFIRRKSGIKQFLIIPDLPQFMNSQANVFKRALKRIDGLLHRQLLKNVNGFFLLTEYMADLYSIDKSRYIVLEGIADLIIEAAEEPITKKKAILYTGALSERYGLIKLVEAFEKCEDVGELWICGEGSARAIIEAACKTNNNIRYFGQLPREQVLRKQKEATLLVNPRNSSDQYTWFSFPSKTMEYLQSGTPLLMARLKGIPKEYEPYIHWVEDETVDGWAREISRCMCQSDEERRRFGKNSQQFVSENKQPLAQGRRIKEFIIHNIRRTYKATP